MKTFKIPNYITGFGCDKDNIVACQQAGVLPKAFGIFGTADQWRDVSPVQPPLEGSGAKYWRDNSVFWNFEVQDRTFLMLARNTDGSYVVGKGDVNPLVTSTVLGLSTINFYNTYQAYFPTRPSFDSKLFSKEVAGNLNFSTGPSIPVPVGYGNNLEGTTDLQLAWPTDMALRFTNGNTEVEAFYIEDFKKENPLVKATTSVLTDSELVNAATFIIGSTMSVNGKASSLRNLLK